MMVFITSNPKLDLFSESLIDVSPSESREIAKALFGEVGGEEEVPDTSLN